MSDNEKDLRHSLGAIQKIIWSESFLRVNIIKKINGFGKQVIGFKIRQINNCYRAWFWFS